MKTAILVTRNFELGTAAQRKAKAAERKLIKQLKAARKRGIAPEDFVEPGYEPTIDPDLLD